MTKRKGKGREGEEREGKGREEGREGKKEILGHLSHAWHFPLRIKVEF